MVCDSYGRISVGDKSGVATGLVVFLRQKNFKRRGRSSSRNLLIFELCGRLADPSIGLVLQNNVFDHPVELRLSVLIRLQIAFLKTSRPRFKMLTILLDQSAPITSVF